MRYSVRCNCEAAYCNHSPGPCYGRATSVTMFCVGMICDQCAVTVTRNGGAQLLKVLTEVNHGA
jgi:hypothetical protein